MLVDGDFSHTYVENLEWARKNGIAIQAPLPPKQARLCKKVMCGTEPTRRLRMPPGQQLKAGENSTSSDTS
jgi:hypothetical protein